MRPSFSRRLIRFGLFVVCCSCFCSLMQNNVNAYFGTGEGDNGKYQCFAIQYKDINAGTAFTRVDAREGDGTSSNSYSGVGNGTTYGTNKICAYVDDNGKIKGDKIYERGQLGNTEPMKHPQLTVPGTPPIAKFVYCGTGLNTCGAKELDEGFDARDFDTFREFAEAIYNFAKEKQPTAQGDATIEPFESTATTGSAQEEAEQEADEKAAAMTEEEFGDGEDECYKNSGALGWILCPLISNVTEALGTIYDGMVEPFLVIEPELLQGDGTYTAWDIFRNFANIAFVILFLAVIFSQLTGVGIDNYGIKRMLPKLIVAAVLINLSYVICQLAVDISNILGNSLNSLFINIAGRVNANAISPTMFFSSTVDTVGSVLGVGTGVGTILATFTVGLASGFALIIPILATVLSAIISVIFMFVILFVRKAIAILLVAVAPVAFVAYIMPNTKRLVFDKWLNVFKGALLLYPLAGALIGGGLLASAIIISALGASAASGNAGLQEFFMYIGALLIQVVPFFFLPTLFRRSLTALGNVGERLGRAGTQLGAGASRRFRENEGVQMAQARMAAGRQGGLRQRMAERMPSFMGRNGMARSRMRYQKMLGEQGSLNAMYGEDYLLGTETANVMKELEASGEINDSRALRRGLQNALINGDRARIRAYTDALSAKGDSGRDAVKGAYNAVAPQISQVAAETFAANIMANHAADYKNNNRSLFDVANGINNGNITRGANGYQTTVQYVGTHKNQLQTSAKAETMAAMDDSAFAEAFMNGNYENGTVNNLSGLSDEERDAVGANAYRALQNTTNMKADRVARLRQVLQQSGYQPPAQDVHVV